MINLSIKNLLKKDKSAKAEKDYNNNPMKIYGNLIFEHFSKGLSDTPEDLSYVENQICYNKIFTQNYVEYYFQVRSFGNELSYSILSILRDTIRNKYGRKVYVDLITECTPHRIKWNSTSMKNNLVVWRNARKRNQKRKSEDDKEGFSSAHHDQLDSRQKRLENSWEYFKRCDEMRTETCLATVVLRVRIPKEDLAYSTFLFEVIDEVFMREEISISPVTLYLYDFLQLISPFKHETSKLARTLVANRVLTTEHTASLGPLTQGKLNDGNIILGNDIKNRQLVKIDTHPKDQSGTNALVVGMTGSGKSCLVKAMLEQILAIGDYIYITDYEGNEYTPFGDAYGATYLDLQGEDGKYFEPLRLTTLTGDETLDKNVYQNAINGTFQMISVLMGKPLTEAQKNILSQAIEEYAKGFGVNLDDRSTWKNSTRMSIKGLLPKLKVYVNSTQLRNRYGFELTELVDTLTLYFEGVNKNMFRNPISFDELKDKKIIITRFGSDSTASVVGAESVDLRVKQLTKMLLDSEMARYRRSRNESFVMIYEELQRYLTHQGAGDWLNTIWTGIRKSNGTCIGIINDPGKLNHNISALINNSTYFIIGKTEDLVSLEYMFENPKLNNCKPLVEGLVNLNRCFLLTDSKVTTIFHCELPDAYIRSPIFSTRSDGAGA